MYRHTALLLIMLCQPTAQATVLADDDFTGFRATGLAPAGTDGSLDSLRYAVHGASEGDTEFGAMRSGGDFGRGVSSGGVRSGGVYAFLLPGGDTGVGIQATASDFSPGAIVRRVINAAGTAVHDLSLAMDLWYLNDGDRSTRMAIDFSTSSRPAWSALPGLVLETPSNADASGWQRWPVLALLPLTALAASDTLLLRWRFSDAGGRGSRDELALSSLRLSGSTAAPGSVPAPLGEPRSLLLALLLAAVPWVAHRRARAGARDRGT